MKKQINIEANNLLNEINEILSPCVKCGMCKSLCPVFKVLQEESVSPRGKAILLSDSVLDRIIFQCNLCKACEEKCPLNLKICEAIRKAREAMVLEGKELGENKEMIENIRRTGNPFGKNIDKTKEKLYCC
jgi:Fe-S oxidoreductase